MSGATWDASMPGAGAQRVCAIAQLYFRIINYGALTTLVVDALCNAFSEDGATITELSNYLGIGEDRVLIALEAIPLTLRVTSDELDNITQNENSSASTYNTLDRNAKVNKSVTTNSISSYNNTSNPSRKRNKLEEVRYYLNFKRLLPTAYAHISYLLLSLCQIPLPTTTSLSKKGTRAFLSNNMEMTSAAVKRDAESQKLTQLRATPTLFASSSLSTANIDSNDSDGKKTTSTISDAPSSQNQKYSGIDEYQEKEDIKLTNHAIRSEPAPSKSNINVTSSSNTNNNKNIIKEERVHDLVDLVNATFNISAVLRRKEATCGVYCASCRSYFALEEFASTIRKCLMCNCDVLASILLEIKNEFDRKVNNNEPLITPLPQVRAAFTATHETRMKTVQSGSANNEHTNNANTTEREHKSRLLGTNTDVKIKSTMNVSKAARDADTEKDDQRHNTVKADSMKKYDLQTKTASITYALASDPYLVQQAFAFFNLFSVKFAYVSDARQIVNSEDILTESEYARRLDGRASIADQFRARHRNPHSIRVRVVDQANEDNMMRCANALKIAKRTQLPPWLRHQPIMHSLNLSGTINTNDDDDCYEWMSDMYGKEINEPTMEEKSRIETQRTKRTKYENKSENSNSSSSSPVQIKRQRLQHMAQYIASEFYDNDYDLVAS